MTYFRPNIEQMKAYEPGEQPAPGEKVIKLNTNENPYPPSPEAVKALKKFDQESLRLYPDPLSRHVREAAGRIYNYPIDWIMAGNGSDELLAYIARVALEPGRKAVYPVPTYLYYPVLAAMQDSDFVEIPYKDDFKLPVKELIRAKGAVTFICSPNNPSGNVAGTEDIRRLAAGLKGLLVMDEAYIDFAGEGSLGLVSEFENMIVLRTLSKGYSLAGLRLGFAIANPGLLKRIFKIKDSYNVNAMACRIGVAALLDQPYLKKTVARIKETRAKLAGALTGLGFQVWPSDANFIMVRPPRGEAEALFQFLRKKGIYIRFFRAAGLEDKLRISIGTDAEMDTLISQIKSFLK